MFGSVLRLGLRLLTGRTLSLGLTIPALLPLRLLFLSGLTDNGRLLLRCRSRWLVAGLLWFLFLFLLFGLVKAREVILRSQVDRLGLFALFFLTFTLELQRLLAPTVHLDYLKRPLGIDGHQIGICTMQST